MNRSKEDSLGPVYEWLEGAESLERYAEGGYHPVKLDDEFCAGRYHVVHKLGKGSYSTVWLARDRQANRYVALKILVSEIPTPSSESHILHGLAKHRKSIPNLAGGHHVLELLDEFTIIGPNGQHTCLVTEPLGCSIGASREASSIWLFQLQVARAIAAKLITGVHFLHSADVVHGDLHSNNIMLKLPNMDTLSTEELYTLACTVACEAVTDPSIAIVDFGEAYEAVNGPRSFNTPVLLSPPEALIGEGAIGMPADIWTLACTLIEVLGGGPLFEDFPDPDLVMGEIVSALGKPPDHIWRAWHNKSQLFLDDGSRAPSSRRDHFAGSRPLRQRIAEAREGGEDFEDEEIEALEKMMAGMLKWDPRERWRIEEVTASEWMERFGKPAMSAFETEAT